MSKPGLSFGLSLSKKPGASKAGPAKRRPVFGGDDSDDDAPKAGQGHTEQIGELDGTDALSSLSRPQSTTRKNKGRAAPPTEPPALKAKKGQENAMFGDLSSSLTSRKNAEEAEELDPNIYEYDKVYDKLKPQSKKPTPDEQDAERKPRYMSNLLAAAAVRKRDALIAEEKKIARDREAEGEEFADKEKFVTEAYRKQQEENRRLEEEEKRREEEEVKKNKTGGMNAFYKGLLNKGEERHREIMQAAEEQVKEISGQDQQQQGDVQDGEEEFTEAARAKEINSHGGSVVMNEEGQVVDKRQLLRGGLNVNAKKDAQIKREASRPKDDSNRATQQRSGFVGAGGKGAMRDRQTRMLEQQLEASLKRSRANEEEEQEKIQVATKSHKTDGDISSAKERYLARKREAEEAKKKAADA